MFPFLCESRLTGYERWTVRQDSLIDDRMHSVLDVETLDAEGAPGPTWQRLFDTRRLGAALNT